MIDTNLYINLRGVSKNTARGRYFYIRVCSVKVDTHAIRPKTKTLGQIAVGPTDNPSGMASVPERTKPMEQKPAQSCEMRMTLIAQCHVASNDGCGEQLFSRIMDVGSVKVLDKTCKNSTTTTDIHTKCHGLHWW
ncbi:hypothetical protein I7I51_04941 [Histoplasma capsulatum]|uniref:Uncharacterized protein n=1 Tax=Ajellomyces capsulatus TaxID=5037 RepID=A0A8A1M678_AJECA|nr:predicted protein [Histoplasma mississippiense (nom. inval.)]EDN09555.1 predicted protein [Histoplasma mississippiense (nom. inval.)]QSS60144.1 hypothetical protein I7I51_04941 [Histoplasma capsulatum]